MTNLFTLCCKRHYFSLLLIVAISVLSLAPMPEIEMAKDVPLADKWTHMVMYGTLSLSYWVEHLQKHTAPLPLRLFLGGFLLPILMGGAMEWMQANLTTYRSGDWLDFVANSIGVCIACVLGLILLATKSNKRKTM